MRTIRMIKIGENGEQLPDDAAQHAAVLLPDHGLMFTARVINSEEQPQTELEEACTKVSCAGFTDWTMPEIEELELVVDRSRYEPAINPAFFPDMPIDWLWSKTPAAWSSYAAWYVDADYGYVYYRHRSSSGFALAVRRAGQ